MWEKFFGGVAQYLFSLCFLLDCIILLFVPILLGRIFRRVFFVWCDLESGCWFPHPVFYSFSFWLCCGIFSMSECHCALISNVVWKCVIWWLIKIIIKFHEKYTEKKIVQEFSVLFIFFDEIWTRFLCNSTNLSNWPIVMTKIYMTGVYKILVWWLIKIMSIMKFYENLKKKSKIREKDFSSRFELIPPYISTNLTNWFDLLLF